MQCQPLIPVREFLLISNGLHFPSHQEKRSFQNGDQISSDRGHHSRLTFLKALSQAEHVIGVSVSDHSQGFGIVKGVTGYVLPQKNCSPRGHGGFQRHSIRLDVV